MIRLLVLSALGLLAASSALAQTTPNVVLIVMDDVGYGDYGATAPRTCGRRTSTGWRARV